MRTEHFLSQFISDCNQKPIQSGDTMWCHVAKNIQNFYVTISYSESFEKKDWHYKESDFNIECRQAAFWRNEEEPEVAEYWLDDYKVNEWFDENKKAGHVMGIIIMRTTFDDDGNATESYNLIYMEIDGIPVEKEP
jgi:hypothetical protein